MNSITISGQNMLDTWLTKSVQKSISSVWHFSCPKLTKTELEAEKINARLDQRASLADTVISQEVFNSENLYTVQNGGILVSYGHYYISGNKGISNNMLSPIVHKMLINSLNYNNSLDFDYDNFDYSFTSARFINISQGGYVQKVVASAQIQVKSKLDGTIINTQPLQFNIVSQNIDLFDNPVSVLERMGINMLNNGTYGLTRWENNKGLIEFLQINNCSIEEEDKWFFEYWENQQREYVKKTFDIEDPKIEPIKINEIREFPGSFTERRLFVEILMDKSKDTFYDTFRAVYGVDYQEAINKLINEGRGSEAALLESMHKIKLFGRVDEHRYDPTAGYKWVVVYRDYYATGLQIFLDENETIGFGTGNTEQQQYQRGFTYKWEYEKKKQ